MSDDSATKQTASDRAMFANMGSSGGGSGGKKPSGGQGGLWKVNPETGKREPGQGLEKGAAPTPATSTPTPARTSPTAAATAARDRMEATARANDLAGREQRRAATRDQILRDQAARDAAPAGKPATAKPNWSTPQVAKQIKGKTPMGFTSPDGAQVLIVPNGNGKGQHSISMSGGTSKPQQRTVSTAELTKIVLNMQGKGYQSNFGLEGKSMDALKASRRNSAQDMAYGLQARAKLQEADDLLLLAGFDDTPDVASVPWEGKALDLETHCQIVKHAVHEALEDAEELDDDEQPVGMVPMAGCQITVYSDFAIACLDDGRDIKIGYTLDGIDVEIDDPAEWMLVEAEWTETGAYGEEDDDAVKSLGADRIGGYAVRFGSEDEPDLSEYRDYFTKSTDFWLDAWPQRPMLYHHAQDEATKDAPVVGMWTSARMDDVGVWLEGQLNSAHRYATAIKEMIRRGALRLSSDSAPHLVVRATKANGTHEIKRWPLLACSLTVSPAEPRLLSVQALKAAFHDAGLLPPAELIDESPEADDPESPRDGHSVKRLSDADAVAIELELVELALMEIV